MMIVIIRDLDNCDDYDDGIDDDQVDSSMNIMIMKMPGPILNEAASAHFVEAGAA